MDETKQVEIQKNIDDMKEKIKDVIDIDRVNDLIKDNKYEFEYQNIKYRVNKPNFKQKQDINNKRITKYAEMLKNDSYLLEEDLIKLYKKRGIDIKELDNQSESLSKRIRDYLLQLGKMIKENKSEDECKIIRDEIENLRIMQQEISMKRVVYLETSIESQINVFVYSYLAFITTEKLIEDKWVLAWKNYDDFMSADETLINQLVWYSSLFSKNEIASF